MAYRTIGCTIAEWDDTEPLRFTICKEVGPHGGREIQAAEIDLTDLRAGFTKEFLTHLKDFLLERCNQVVPITIATEAKNLKRLFAHTIALKLFDSPVTVIDENFLLPLTREQQQFTKTQLSTLKRHFSASPHSPLFANALVEDDFPTHKNKKGEHGRLIDRVLATALSRATVAHILDVCDNAYASGTMDIGHYSFVHLAFAVYVRPNSYRQIRLSDFTFDTESNKYFIWIVTSKTGEELPSKVLFEINEPLGVLLAKQRQHVVATYGHLVDQSDIEKLALFPARQLVNGNSRWRRDHANQHFGMLESGDDFAKSYARAIREKYFDGTRFTLNATALRHTVGTLLAQTGASAKTIAAVLKHASDGVCHAYVDIAFKGMIDELSEAMRPAFAEHLPDLLNFRSKSDPVAAQKLIRAEDLATGQMDDTGECGKAIACANAPIVCYGCFRFRPFWDADHRINLNIVQREIDDMSRRGNPFRQMVDRARTAKQHILIVMNAADRYRESMQRGAQA